MLTQTQIDEVISNVRTSNKAKDAVLKVLVTPEHFDFMYGEVYKLLDTNDSWSQMMKLKKAERPDKYSAEDCETFELYNTLRGWKSAVTTTKAPKTPFEKVKALLTKNGFTVEEYVWIASTANAGRAEAAMAPTE